MLSKGATSALDASKTGRCFGRDVRIRFGRNRQRDGRGGRNKETGEANLRDRRGESDGKYAAKRNNRHQMPGKGTTSIECLGKGGDKIAD